ncbi:MAG: molybdopterin-guanine dinucleotide biosynthesis protein B [Gammaproteobacteria bacterium HGW-Gammaproteobacteria-3]|nr:MAG: molybdopterin-guanine dinucleotide biosynthesis protein B [Gammaproteobacteria bacterium HGW-Gammaproteobacteria-3]
MLQSRPPILGFAAFSGTGKTTLLTQLIPLLKQQGLALGLIKHSHHSFDIDQPGKDSYRLRAAGAATVLLASSRRRAIITEFEPEQEPRLTDQISALAHTKPDLILVEGFKAESFPKIELHRPALNKPLLYPDDRDIIAVASDCPLALPEHLVALDINAPDQIAQFILTRFMEPLRD